MSLIGQRWKRSNVCSWLILISRKLDLKQAQCWPNPKLQIEFNVQFSRYIPWRPAPLAQLVEQLTLNQWVPGSSPWRCTKWPIGQVVKTAASHAVNIGSNPVWVTKSLKLETVLIYKMSRDIHIVRIDCDEGPPVPIPNTEVKLICADDSCRVTGRENR